MVGLAGEWDASEGKIEKVVREVNRRKEDQSIKCCQDTKKGKARWLTGFGERTFGRVISAEY